MTVDLEFNYDDTTAAMDKFSRKNIEELRNWSEKLDKSKLVPKDLSDKQLVLFYNACYGDLDKTKTCMENYYTCRRNAPEIFNHRDPMSEDLKKAAEVFQMFVLPGKSCDGYEVIYNRLHDNDISKFNMEAMCKLLLMTVDLCLSIRGPTSGVIFLFDMHGSKLGHLTKISLYTLRKLLTYIQDAVPLRMKAKHILNTEPFVDKLLVLLKPFMDKKFLSMIKFHNKNEEPAELYEVVPKSSLPLEHLGELPGALTLHKQCMGKLQDITPYFKAEEEQRMAAIPDQKGGNTLEASFKKLDID